MSVDEDVVARNAGQKCGDIANTTHVRRQVIDLVDILGRLQAAFPSAQVKNLKFIGSRILVFGGFDIDTSDPVPFLLQSLYQVMTDETAGARNQNSRRIRHYSVS